MGLGVGAAAGVLYFFNKLKQINNNLNHLPLSVSSIKLNQTINDLQQNLDRLERYVQPRTNEQPQEAITDDLTTTQELMDVLNEIRDYYKWRQWDSNLPAVNSRMTALAQLVALPNWQQLLRQYLTLDPEFSREACNEYTRMLAASVLDAQKMFAARKQLVENVLGEEFTQLDAEQQALAALNLLKNLNEGEEKLKKEKSKYHHELMSKELFDEKGAERLASVLVTQVLGKIKREKAKSGTRSFLKSTLGFVSSEEKALAKLLKNSAPASPYLKILQQKVAEEAALFCEKDKKIASASSKG